MLHQLICAVQFLTILPIRGNYVREDEDLARSMIFYPVVGLLIGLTCVAFYHLSSRIFTPAISLVIAYIFGIIFTGGLHLDGFADMCDGFYAGKDKSEILSIMKDSHIGTMAVLGLFCLLSLKLSLLFSILLRGQLIETLLVVPAISRWVMTMSAVLYPYARMEGGTGKPFVENIGIKEAIISSLFISIISYLVVGTSGIVVSIATLGVALIFMQWVKKKIGGITGDILGGLNEISEISALFLLQLSFAIVRKGWLS